MSLESPQQLVSAFYTLMQIYNIWLLDNIIRNGDFWEISNRFYSSLILLILSDCFIIIFIIRMINSTTFSSFIIKGYTQILLFASVFRRKQTFYTNWQRRWETGVRYFFLSIYLLIQLII